MRCKSIVIPRIGKALLGQLYEGELNAILMFVKYAVNRGQEIQLPVEINQQTRIRFVENQVLAGHNEIDFKPTFK